MSTKSAGYSIDADHIKLFIKVLHNNKTVMLIRCVQTVPMNIYKDAEYDPTKIQHGVVIDSYEDKYDYDKVFEIYIEDVDNDFFRDWPDYKVSKLKNLLIYSIVYFFLYTRFRCSLVDGIIIEDNISTVKQFFDNVEPDIKSLANKENDKMLYNIYKQFKLNFSKYIKNYTQLYTNIENYLKLELKSQIPLMSNHIDDENAVIYCVGDLEGDLDIIYNWFLDRKFINTVGEWIAPSNVYVLQLGDQLDTLSQKGSGSNPSFYRRSRHPHLRTYDFEVVLFFEYLRYKSNNHVISVLGNHDWMQSPNYVLDFNEQITGIDDRYKSRNDSLSNELFQPGGIIYSILMKRPFLVRINNVIGSHAGFSTNSFNGIVRYVKENNLESNNFDYILDMINDKENLIDFDNWYKDIIYPIIWNRDFEEDKCINIEGISRMLSKLVPSTKEITGTETPMIIQQVIGHNTFEKIEVCKNSDGENILIKVDTGYVSRKCDIKTNKTQLKYAILKLRDDKMLYNIKQEEFDYNCGVGKKTISRPILRFVDFL
jgi:hypothetical protein